MDNYEQDRNNQVERPPRRRKSKENNSEVISEPSNQIHVQQDPQPPELKHSHRDTCLSQQSQVPQQV